MGEVWFIGGVEPKRHRRRNNAINALLIQLGKFAMYHSTRHRCAAGTSLVAEMLPLAESVG